MIGPGRSATATLAAVALAAGLASGPGCAFAVDHPAITAGTVGTTLAFGTCKLASDDYAGCALVSGGAGAFLAIVAATAIWLGGDGHTVMVEEQAKPLPDDGRPIRRRRPPPAPAANPADPAASPADPAASPTAPSASPAAPAPGSAPPSNGPPPTPAVPSPTPAPQPPANP
jgi:hypothetical protein